MTAAGPLKQSIVKDRASSSQGHVGSVEPTENPTLMAQSRRPTSEPVTKLSRQQQQLQHHLFARLKVASDDALHIGRVKKPKSGIEIFAAAAAATNTVVKQLLKDE